MALSLHPPQRDTASARIAVLMGGPSTEREVSLKSGKAVLQALLDRGWDAVGIDVGPDLAERLHAERAEVAWIALHGAIGEDGCVQGLLEVLRIPYTGSPVRGSAVAMDKIATKRALAGQGLNLPADMVWIPGEPYPEHAAPDCVVKVPQGGSTIGTWVCRNSAEFEAALVQAEAMGDRVLLEQFVAGEEITVAVLDGQPLPVVAIRPDSGFFDFEAKYTKGRTQYLVPAPLPEETARTAQEHARRAYETLGLAGVARADFIVDGDGRPWFLEVNTSPGFTATSLSPMAAGAVGLSFEDLVDHLARTARLHVHP
ncbi:MAG: D-alanine--D-alanine ligase [Alphaproteobacteria bacterium]|nr:D-alanine--D-alanine ligase [Alphaproteobacteria bacterium]